MQRIFLLISSPQLVGFFIDWEIFVESKLITLTFPRTILRLNCVPYWCSYSTCLLPCVCMCAMFIIQRDDTILCEYLGADSNPWMLTERVSIKASDKRLFFPMEEAVGLKMWKLFGIFHNLFLEQYCLHNVNKIKHCSTEN